MGRETPHNHPYHSLGVVVQGWNESEPTYLVDLKAALRKAVILHSSKGWGWDPGLRISSAYSLCIFLPLPCFHPHLSHHHLLQDYCNDFLLVSLMRTVDSSCAVRALHKGIWLRGPVGTEIQPVFWC